RRWKIDRIEAVRLDKCGLGRSRLRAVHRDEARTETLEAGEIFVAVRLIDLPLAAPLRVERGDGDAVRLRRAIAAALAHQIVDEDALVRIGESAALAAAALL